MSRKDRPIGITIISILIMISGALWILAGVMILADVAGFTEQIEDILGSGAAAIVGALGIIMLFIGFLIFLEGLGLWKLNIIAYIIALISLGLNVLGILLNYKYFLTLIINDLIVALINPIITILIFIYFIKVRNHF